MSSSKISSPQIPLDLSPEPDFSFSRFEAGLFNSNALRAVQSWPDWPWHILALYGPSGVGKTHLGRAWAKQSNAVVLDGSALTDISSTWRERAVFIDHAERTPEPVLFAILNMALNGDAHSLLLASSKPPKLWDVELPDLASRLRNLHAERLEEPEDDALEAIVRKLFEDKGRTVPDDAIHYMLAHCDRSVEALRVTVHALDHAARTAKMDIKKRFIANYVRDQTETLGD